MNILTIKMVLSRPIRLQTIKATPEPPKPTFGQQMAETLNSTVDQMGTQKVIEGITQGVEDVTDEGGDE